MLMCMVGLDRNRRRAMRCKAREEAERRERQMNVMADDRQRRRLRRVESDYSYDRLRDSWTRNLQQMYDRAGAPESRWWSQYMLMAVVSACCSL